MNGNEGLLIVAALAYMAILAMNNRSQQERRDRARPIDLVNACMFVLLCLEAGASFAAWRISEAYGVTWKRVFVYENSWIVILAIICVACLLAYKSREKFVTN